ncbi:MAG: DUF3883 domain-containing protein [Gammaproteobacteria bacterium]|nr:DUF3883 domain-containing protein [Gammaproteobacteria bacterium]
MLKLELSLQSYNKADRNRRLRERLDERSRGSVEFKHQNISAVLVKMGIPYIEGYKPKDNFQNELARAVRVYIEKNPKIRHVFLLDADQVPVVPAVEDWSSVIVDPPEPSPPNVANLEHQQLIYIPGGINYLEREARNQKLGDAGEVFIMELERERLINEGCEPLAKRIEQVSVTQGSMAGFDILSFEKNGQERFIEVKTTKYGINTPWFVSSNELSCSHKNNNNYYLYRLFNFNNKERPQLFKLKGNLQNSCRLEPTEYRARV